MLRDFRHALANVVWVIFGMVDILTELDAQRPGERRAGDPLTPVEEGAASLKLALAPLFENDGELLDNAELRAMIAAVEPIVDTLESRTIQLHAAIAHDAIVRRSVASVLSAVGDIRRQLAEFVAAHPEIGLPADGVTTPR